MDPKLLKAFFGEFLSKWCGFEIKWIASEGLELTKTDSKDKTSEVKPVYISID